MARRPLAVFLALLASSAALAGCFGGDDAPAAEVQPTPANETNTTTAELPTGDTCVACQEVNTTEEGVGGMDHKHDYWEGKETILVYDYDVVPELFPVFERGDHSRAFIGYVNLEMLPEDPEKPALVFEGTGKVTFTITSAPAWADTFDLTFRSAAKDWSPMQPIKLNEPFEYEPEKIETDMPHSFRSLWNWKLYAKGPLPVTGDVVGMWDDDLAQQPIHVQIVVTKARDVDDWPGHPAFYDGVEERVVADNKKGSTTVQQAADVLVYGVEPDQVVPDKLISMGSKTLDVWVNITRLELPPGVPNGGFTLYWRTADTRPDDLGIFSKANETDDATYAHWTLTLEDSMLDSPYQPESRFGFKVLANVANDDRFACYRCVPYTIEYVMTVIARPDPDAAAATTMD